MTLKMRGFPSASSSLCRILGRDSRSKYRAGHQVNGKVTSLTDFGVFVEMEEGIEGLIHVSELSREKLASTKDFATVGDELEAVVLSVDMVEKKIALSIKSHCSPHWIRLNLPPIWDPREKQLQTFGDLLKEKLKKGTED